MYKLSIVIPCFNCESNIGILLATLNEQWSPFVEYLFINDGSIDNTRDIIQFFIHKEKKNNYILVNKKNEGAAKARQYGLSISRGQYIFFCDSDDIITSDFVANIIYNCSDNLFDIIYFNSIRSISTNEKCSIQYKVKFEETKIFNNPNEFMEYQLLNKNWTAAVWTCVFKKELAIYSKASFSNRKAHEDHSFIIPLIYTSNRILCIDRIFYIQQITDGSLTNSKKDWSYIKERYLAYLEIMDNYSDFMNDTVSTLYREWSVSSFFKILFEDKINILIALKYIYFYNIILNNFDILLKILMKKLNCGNNI